MRRLAVLLVLLAPTGCGLFDDARPPASAWESLPAQRIVTVGVVTFDVNLRWFTGDERSLMVHRVDKQPMFALDFERETAGRAVMAAYGADVCFGRALAIEKYEHASPGVWIAHGRCPAGATPAPGARLGSWW